MRLAWFGPLPPVRSGIAHYASLLIPELEREHEVRLFSDQAERDGTSPEFRPSSELRPHEFDAVFVQLGNNPYHEAQYRWAMEHSATLVIHDLVLHHLLVEMTLARGDAAAYEKALAHDHGAEGAAWARARTAGVHGEIGNFLFPAFASVASRARHIVVHNRWAAECIRAAGIEVPITVAPHPWVAAPEPPARARRTFLERYAIPRDARVVSMLGFVTAAKRVEETMRAFGVAARLDPSLHLLIAGAPAPNVDLEAIAASAGVERARWTTTGYLADDEFDIAVAVSERVVNLRYPSAGETSGPLMRVIGTGTHVAVSDYAQFRELPEGSVVRIPLGEREHQAIVEYIAAATNCDPAIQRTWASRELSPERAVQAYERAARGEGDAITVPLTKSAAIPLFVEWQWTAHRESARVRLELRLQSEAPVRSACWGDPGYRLLTSFVLEDGTERTGATPLPRDVNQGESVDVTVEAPDGWRELRVWNGLEGIPAGPGEPFAVVVNDAVR